jgi:hypothetical protein
MPLWLTMLFLLVVLLAIGETLFAIRHRPPTIILAAPDVRRHLVAWPLRLVAGLAVLFSFLQRSVYRGGRSDPTLNLFTTACLVVALGLIAVSYRLAKTGRL